MNCVAKLQTIFGIKKLFRKKIYLFLNLFFKVLKMNILKNNFFFYIFYFQKSNFLNIPYYIENTISDKLSLSSFLSVILSVTNCLICDKLSVRNFHLKISYILQILQIWWPWERPAYPPLRHHWYVNPIALNKAINGKSLPFYKPLGH